METYCAKLMEFEKFLIDNRLVQKDKAKYYVNWADMVVEDKVILELKSIETVSAAHKKQVLTYLKLTGCKLGYLLNFGEGLMMG